MTFYSASHLVLLALPKLHNGAYWEFLGVGLAAPSLEEKSVPGEVMSVLQKV